LAYSIHLHHLTEILSQPRSASRILSRSRSFHFLGWDRPISFLPGKRGSELTLDPYSFLVLHSRGRGWTGLAFTCWEKESGSGYDWGWG